MSANIISSLTIDKGTENEKTYKLFFSKALQVRFQELQDEKLKNAEYQQEITESERLKAEYEKIKTIYDKAQDEYYADMANKDKQAIFEAVEQRYLKVYNNWLEYSTTHVAPNELNNRTLWICGQLVLLGLETQYNLSKEEAENVWNKYVEQNGYVEGLEFLSSTGVLWLGAQDGDSENPFVQQMRERAIQQADNRKTGLSKVKK